MASHYCINRPYTASLNSTQLSPINERSDPVDSVCRSWRHKQKYDWLGCTLFNWVSWVELCRYRHFADATQLNWTSSWVVSDRWVSIATHTYIYIYKWFITRTMSNKMVESETQIQRSVYSDTTQLNSTTSWVELNCVAINTPLRMCAWPSTHEFGRVFSAWLYEVW